MNLDFKLHNIGFFALRMNSMGMTTYMYAPKDDAKHRAFWRDLYSVEEAGNKLKISNY